MAETTIVITALRLIGAATLVFCSSACGWFDRPMAIRVQNMSDQPVEVASLFATPEFAYSPVVGSVARDGHALSTDVVRTPPIEVTIMERGENPVKIAVPPLPDDAKGEIEFLVTHTRSGRWVTQWEIIPGRDELHNPIGARLIPDDADHAYGLHQALVEAARSGNTAEVGRLIDGDAPLTWDTTTSNPLVVAAAYHRNATVERLIRDHASKFDAGDIESAVFGAADANDDDISTLRLLIAKWGSRLSLEARGRLLRNVAESHRLDAYGTVPAGPAIRYLIEEAGFDVNQSVTSDGGTLLDLAEIPQATFRDEPLIAFLKSAGAKRSDRLVSSR